MTTPADTGIIYPNVTVQLTGEDGNAFAIISAVRRGIMRGVGAPEAELWTVAAMTCNSYSELLRLAATTVHVI
jgi:hypothetical protein